MYTTDLSDDAPGEIGHDALGSYYRPDPLPPELEVDEDLLRTVSAATHELGRLDGLSDVIDVSPVVYTTQLRREAVASTEIEGADLNAEEVYHYTTTPADQTPDVKKDLQEILNYERALTQGVAALEGGDSLSLDLLKSLHTTLLSDVPRSEDPIGEFRDSMVHLPSPKTGKEAFIPPAPHHISPLMEALQTYLTTGGAYHPFVDMALVHYQIETIHPFIDGNGRLGRVLIVLQLYDAGYLSDPYLDPSAYIQRRKVDYVEHLRAVSERGEWLPWIKFFLNALTEQAADAYDRTQALLSLREVYEDRYGGRETVADRLALSLFDTPYVTAPEIQDDLNVSKQAVYNAIDQLEEEGVLEEVTGKERGREFKAAEIFDIVGF